AGLVPDPSPVELERRHGARRRRHQVGPAGRREPADHQDAQHGEAHGRPHRRHRSIPDQPAEQGSHARKTQVRSRTNRATVAAALTRVRAISRGASAVTPSAPNNARTPIGSTSGISMVARLAAYWRVRSARPRRAKVRRRLAAVLATAQMPRATMSAATGPSGPANTANSPANTSVLTIPIDAKR